MTTWAGMSSNPQNLPPDYPATVDAVKDGTPAGKNQILFASPKDADAYRDARLPEYQQWLASTAAPVKNVDPVVVTKAKVSQISDALNSTSELGVAGVSAGGKLFPASLEGRLRRLYELSLTQSPPTFPIELSAIDVDSAVYGLDSLSIPDSDTLTSVWTEFLGNLVAIDLAEEAVVAQVRNAPDLATTIAVDPTVAVAQVIQPLPPIQQKV